MRDRLAFSFGDGDAVEIGLGAGGKVLQIRDIHAADEAFIDSSATDTRSPINSLLSDAQSNPPTHLHRIVLLMHLEPSLLTALYASLLNQKA